MVGCGGETETPVSAEEDFKMRVKARAKTNKRTLSDGVFFQKLHLNEFKQDLNLFKEKSFLSI